MKRKLPKLLLIVILMLGSQVFAQEIIYGQVEAHGYDKITKGAFWKKRPEAKIIYEGGEVPGYYVTVLEEDFFVRFVDGENNQFDINFIVFPKGERVYTDQSGQFYSAKCGNKIAVIRPVNRVQLLPESGKTGVEENQFQNERKIVPEDNGWQQQNSPIMRTSEVDSDRISPQQNQQFKRVIDWIKVAKIGGITVGVFITGVLLYPLFKNKKGKPQDAPPVGGSSQDGQPVGGP